jgi:hypothetical protein
VDLFASPTPLKKNMYLLPSLPELSTLNLVECKFDKQYKVSLLSFFKKENFYLLYILYILSELKLKTDPWILMYFQK